MTTETNEQAAAPAEAEIVNDGIIDLDQVEDAKPSDEDSEGKPEAKADEAKPEGEPEEKPKKPSGAQRAKAREQRLLSELAARDRELEELRRTATPARAGEDTDAKPPKEDDFPGDYFAYQRALTAYEAGKKASEAINKAFSDRDEADRSVKQSEIVRQRAEAHAERVEDAREIIADFDEVMGEMKGVNVRNDVIDEIMQSDKSALLAYHLAKNPEKLDALNRMSPRELAREMGRLEATVQMPTAKKQTSAPPPASAVKGGASSSSAESDLSSWLKKTYG